MFKHSNISWPKKHRKLIEILQTLDWKQGVNEQRIQRDLPTWICCPIGCQFKNAPPLWQGESRDWNDMDDMDDMVAAERYASRPKPTNLQIWFNSIMFTIKLHFCCYQHLTDQPWHGNLVTPSRDHINLSAPQARQIWRTPQDTQFLGHL